MKKVYLLYLMTSGGFAENFELKDVYKKRKKAEEEGEKSRNAYFVKEKEVL